MNLYEILMVSPEASFQEIRKAYRNRSAETHPDAGGDLADFRLVSEAGEVLTDPEKRREYDSQLNDWHSPILRHAEAAFSQTIVSPIEYIKGELYREKLSWERALRSSQKAAAQMRAMDDNLCPSAAKVVLRRYLADQIASHEFSASSCAKNIDLLSRAVAALTE